MRTKEQNREYMKQYQKDRRARDPEYRDAHRARKKEEMRRRRALNPHESKLRSRIRRWEVFGGTWELFMAYWHKQHGRCAICQRQLELEPDDRRTEPQFDHCHASLRPRGILCLYCNTKLDWYIENADAIEEYLK